MARRNWRSYRLDADYTEEFVGLTIEAFLTALSFPRKRFSILPFSQRKERTLGADGKLWSRIRGFRPFYMQFKRPSAYPDFSNARVVKERKRLKLATSPHSLFFHLREKQKGQKDYQHNVLLKLRDQLLRRSLGDAAYVCPLFLDRSAYRLDLHFEALRRWPFFWRGSPWELEDIIIQDGGRSIQFANIPVLAEHVTIPPHRTVSTAKHLYSFTEEGTGVGFHSPEAVAEGSSKLAAFLSAASAGVLDGENLIAVDEAGTELRNLVEALDEKDAVSASDLLEEGDPIKKWLWLGQWLNDRYSIRQFAFVVWEKPRTARPPESLHKFR